jgi:hypothetical protein
MHPDRIEPAPAHGTREHELQRIVLLELLVDPPDEPEPLSKIARRLREPLAAVSGAAAALTRAGLAHVEAGHVAASAPARYYEARASQRPSSRTCARIAAAAASASRATTARTIRRCWRAPAASSPGTSA